MPLLSIRTLSVSFAGVMLSLIGCTTTIRNPIEKPWIIPDGGDEMRALREAIESNDAATVAKLLEGHSFRSKQLLFLDFESDGRSPALKKREAYGVLEAALGRPPSWWHMSAKDGVCRTEIVKVLLNAELPPRGEDFATAAMQGCVDITQLMLPRMGNDEVTAGLKEFVQRMLVVIHESRGNAEMRAPEWEAFLTWATRTLPEDKASVAQGNAVLAELIRKPAIQRNMAKEGFEKKFKMPFCERWDLFNLVYGAFGGTIMEKCIYVLHGPLKVLQNVPGGVLVTPGRLDMGFPEKTFYLKLGSARRFADDDAIEDMLVHSIGLTQYRTVLGAVKTVQAFQYLGRVNLIAASDIGFQIAPNQD